MLKNWLYASLGIAIAALIVAVIAVGLSIVKGPETTKVAVRASFNDNITIPYPGYFSLVLGWIYVDKDALLYLNVTTTNGTVYGLYIDGVEYSNPATVWLTPGNHTISAIVYAPGETQIKVEYRVGT